MTLTETIKHKLIKALQPTNLNLIDESHLHQGHLAHNGKNESHFRLFITSQKFKNLNLLQQHKLIYAILQKEMKFIHALTIKTSKFNSLIK